MITREQAAAHLSPTFENVYKANGFKANDDSRDEGYGWAIDAALRDLHVSEALLDNATVSEDDRGLFFALCEMYAAQQVKRLFGNRANETSVHGADIDFSSLHRLWEREEKNARARVQSLYELRARQNAVTPNDISVLRIDMGWQA